MKISKKIFMMVLTLALIFPITTFAFLQSAYPNCNTSCEGVKAAHKYMQKTYGYTPSVETFLDTEWATYQTCDPFDQFEQFRYLCRCTKNNSSTGNTDIEDWIIVDGGEISAN